MLGDYGLKENSVYNSVYRVCTGILKMNVILYKENIYSYYKLYEQKKKNVFYFIIHKI